MTKLFTAEIIDIFIGPGACCVHVHVQPIIIQNRFAPLQMKCATSYTDIEFYNYDTEEASQFLNYQSSFLLSSVADPGGPKRPDPT